MKKRGLWWLSGVLTLVYLNVSAESSSEPIFETLPHQDYYDLLRRSEQAMRDKQSANVAEFQQRFACAGSQANQAALGGLYLTGRGVARDDITGYAWLKLAAASGVYKYRELTQILEKSMTPDQRSAADAKVAALKALYGPASTHMTCAQAEATGSHLKELQCEPERADSTGKLVRLRRCEQ